MRMTMEGALMRKSRKCSLLQLLLHCPGVRYLSVKLHKVLLLFFLNFILNPSRVLTDIHFICVSSLEKMFSSSWLITPKGDFRIVSRSKFQAGVSTDEFAPLCNKSAPAAPAACINSSWKYKLCHTLSTADTQFVTLYRQDHHCTLT